MSAQFNLNEIINKITPNIGSILRGLFEAGKENMPGDQHIDELVKKLPSDVNHRNFILVGALAILRIIGLITIDNSGNVRVTSRLAHFAIGSLSRFFEESTPVFRSPSTDGIEEKNLVDFTKALEFVRISKLNGDKDPLHARNIVNIIIKSKQIRRGKKKDVYLHVYHPKWNAYHLVGIGKKDTDKPDDELASLAMEKDQLLLLPHKYKLKPWTTGSLQVTEISMSTGAITDYTYSIKIAKKISGGLPLRKWINERSDWTNQRFKWFTLEEIEQLRSDGGDKIFFSTPAILKNIDLEEIPVSVDRVDDVRIRLRDVILSKYTWLQLVLIPLGIILFVLATFYPESIISFFLKIGVPNIYLQNVSAIIQIIVGIPLIYNFIKRLI